MGRGFVPGEGMEGGGRRGGGGSRSPVSYRMMATKMGLLGSAELAGLDRKNDDCV